MDIPNTSHCQESGHNDIHESSYDLPTVDSTLEQLNIDIPRLQQKRLTLLTYHNKLVPISKLPAELLLKILRELVPRPYSGNPDTSWLPFTYVCRVWRQVALDNPSLWICPDFKRPSLAKCMITRAEWSPLDIVLVDIENYTNYRLIESIFHGYNEEIQSLKIVDHYGYYKDLVGVIGGYCYLPRVQRLILRSYETGRHAPHPPGFEMPLLEELELYHFSLPRSTKPLPFLTTLIIDNSGDHDQSAFNYLISANRILDFLSESPLLQVVKLQNTLQHLGSLSSPKPPSAMKKVSMPNMRQFTLEDTLNSSTVLLLQYLALPNVDNLSIKIDMKSSRMVSLDVSRSVLQQLGHFLSQCEKISWRALGVGTKCVSLSNAETKLASWWIPEHLENEPDSVVEVFLGFYLAFENRTAYLGQIREILPLKEVETLHIFYLPPSIDWEALSTLPTLSHLAFESHQSIETSSNKVLDLQSKGFLRNVAMLTFALDILDNDKLLKERITRCIENGMPLKRVQLLVNESKLREDELLKGLDVEVSLVL